MYKSECIHPNGKLLLAATRLVGNGTLGERLKASQEQFNLVSLPESTPVDIKEQYFKVKEKLAAYLKTPVDADSEGIAQEILEVFASFRVFAETSQ